jgi:glucose/arabinose dehydrogenase
MPPTPRIARVALAGVAALCLLATSPHPAAAAKGYGERLIVDGLENAAAFTFAPDGRIFAAERLTGKIVVITPSTGRRHTFATVPNVVGAKDNELGFDGIELHPRFPKAPYVYAYATVDVRGTPRIRIIRYTASERGGRGTGIDPTVIYQSKTAAGPQHVGGRMLFGPDGYLYVIIGDAGAAANAQDLSVERGKLLRMTSRGAPIPSNPFGSRVWSYGHRNSFGFDFDPKSGAIWETENGPECNDEINRIVPGGNYAWGPNQTCSTPPAAPDNTNQDGPAPRRMPKLWYGADHRPDGPRVLPEVRPRLQGRGRGVLRVIQSRHDHAHHALGRPARHRSLAGRARARPPRPVDRDGADRPPLLLRRQGHLPHRARRLTPPRCGPPGGQRG